jgi:hypothetical protein
MEEIVLWLYAASRVWLPIPDVKTERDEKVFVAYNRESSKEATERRMIIMRAITKVAFDPKEKPLFSGPYGRSLSALFINAIASFEGGYHRLVHAGVWRGDHGKSWCHMQIGIGGGRTQEGWSGKDLVADPSRCFRAGYHILHDSMRECAKKPHNFTWGQDGADVFSVYMSGRCFRGNSAARARWSRALRYFRANKPSLGTAFVAFGN